MTLQVILDNISSVVWYISVSIYIDVIVTEITFNFIFLYFTQFFKIHSYCQQSSSGLVCISHSTVIGTEHIALLHFFDGGYLGCHYLTPTINKASVKTRVYICLGTCVSTLLQYITNQSISNSQGMSIFNFTNCQVGEFK